MLQTRLFLTFELEKTMGNFLLRKNAIEVRVIKKNLISCSWNLIWEYQSFSQKDWLELCEFDQQLIKKIYFSKKILYRGKLWLINFVEPTKLQQDGDLFSYTFHGTLER